MCRLPGLIAGFTLALLAFTSGGARAIQPATVDASKIGPPVGAVVPPFSGVDQFGKAHTLESSLGSKGAMLVFFRSADW
ncbi:MAG: hypothetical protein AB7I50_07460 [Vicinamibacterales bacterium]